LQFSDGQLKIFDRGHFICTYRVLANKLYTADDGSMITSRFPALIDTGVDSLFSFNDF